MQITVSTRHHLALVEAVRQRAHLVLDRLGRIGDRALEGTAVFDVVAGRAWVELRLRLNAGTLVVATAEASDHRSALDQVEEKVRRQVRRAITRPLAQRHAVT
jgi:ribosome-associated translation inhibitor RaiA